MAGKRRGGDEQATLARAFELRSDGMAYNKVADALDAEGHATKRGGTWAPKTIASIIRRTDPAVAAS